MTDNVLFVGGPGSGKSNFLFRTWLAIERAQVTLMKRGLPDDLEYLHAGARHLLEGRFAPHTSRDSTAICEIPIQFREVGAATHADLIIPDMSGELWSDIYEKREWPVAWDRFLTPTTSFILFVQAHSPNQVRALDWVTSERYYKDTALVTPQMETPTQVVLIDWLQILRHELDKRIGVSVQPRLSVVVSAWDRLQGEEAASPDAFLSLNFPMFADYINSSFTGLDIRTFGVSVAAGNLDDESFKLTYLSANPAAQGYAVTDVQTGRLRQEDILSPIYWALGKQGSA